MSLGDLFGLTEGSQRALPVLREIPKQRARAEPITGSTLLSFVHTIAKSQGLKAIEYLPQLPMPDEMFEGSPVGEWVAKIRKLGWVSPEVLEAGIHRIDFNYPLREEELVFLISRYQGKEVGHVLDINDIPKYISGHSLLPLLTSAMKSHRNILEHVGVDPQELYDIFKGMGVWNSLPISKGLARVYEAVGSELASGDLFYFPKKLNIWVGGWSLSTWVNEVLNAYRAGGYSPEDRKLLEASGLPSKRLPNQGAARVSLVASAISNYSGDIELVKSLTEEQKAALLGSQSVNSAAFNEEADAIKRALLDIKKKTTSHKASGEFPQSRSTLRYDDNIMVTLKTYVALGYLPQDMLKDVKEARDVSDIEALESKFLLVLEGATKAEKYSFSDSNRNFRMSLRLMLSTIRGIQSILELHFTEHPLKTVIDEMLAEEDTLVTPCEVVERYAGKIMTHRKAVGFLSQELLLL